MRILAIDPGYERLGIAIIEKNLQERELLTYSDCFQTDKSMSQSDRLGLIFNEIERIVKEFKPAALAMETLFFSTNQKTATKVAEVRGVLLSLASKHGLKTYEYGPGQIKVAVTGYGKSDKKQLISMIPRLIKINKEIKYDDEYDAIAVGLTCLATEKF